MKWPSEKYYVIRGLRPGSRWSGPCGDSFCYASCDSAHCHSLLRLAETPHKHNIILARMKRQEREAAKQLLREDNPKDSG